MLRTNFVLLFLLTIICQFRGNVSINDVKFTNSTMALKRKANTDTKMKIRMHQLIGKSKTSPVRVLLHAKLIMLRIPIPCNSCTYK